MTLSLPKLFPKRDGFGFLPLLLSVGAISSLSLIYLAAPKTDLKTQDQILGFYPTEVGTWHIYESSESLRFENSVSLIQAKATYPANFPRPNSRTALNLGHTRNLDNTTVIAQLVANRTMTRGPQNVSDAGQTFCSELSSEDSRYNVLCLFASNAGPISPPPDPESSPILLCQDGLNNLFDTTAWERVSVNCNNSTLSNGEVRITCANNTGVGYVLRRCQPLVGKTLNVEVTYTQTTDSQDGAGTGAIKFASTSDWFDNEALFFGAPNADSLKFSVRKWQYTMLQESNRTPSLNRPYRLLLAISATRYSFKVFDGSTEIVSLSQNRNIVDFTNRRVALHCSEAGCRFKDLKIWETD
jgi:hypothetical protein